MVRCVISFAGAAISLAAIRLFGQATAPLNWMEGGAYVAFVLCLITAVITLWRELSAERKERKEELKKLREKLERGQHGSTKT